MPSSVFTSFNQIVSLICLALWAGGTFFFSFLTTPKIFSMLRDRLPANPPAGLNGLTAETGRRLAGDLVGSLFPNYFGFQIVVGLCAVAAGTVLAWNGHRLERVRCAFTAIAFAVVALHATTVYPRSVSVLCETYQARDAGDNATADRLYQRFGMWHGISQVLNIATIVTVLAALVTAALSLRDTHSMVV